MELKLSHYTPPHSYQGPSQNALEYADETLSFHFPISNGGSQEEVFGFSCLSKMKPTSSEISIYQPFIKLL